VLDSLSVKQRAEGWSRWIQASLSGARTDTGTDTPHRLLVAEIGDRIVGWDSFGAGRESEASHLGELAGLYVHPEFWSKMIGHALMTRVNQELLTEGWDEAYLWVLHGNDRAIRFYEQHGWYADGIEKVDAAGGASNLRELRFRRVLC
jgi:GNAT superfamily N-acetyltransferase